MKKIRTMVWALKMTFILHPFRMVINFFVTVVSAIIPVWLAVYIGNSVNAVAGLLNRSDGKLSDFIMTFITLGIFLILDTFFFYGSGIITSALNVNVSTRINEKFLSAVRNVPVKYFDDTEFCDRFLRVQEGFESIVPMTDTIFIFIGEIISFIAAILVIAKTSLYLILPVLVSFFIGFRLNMWSKKVQHNYWVDTAKQRRFSAYIARLFFLKPAAKEIRSFHMQDFLFNKWSSINERLREESFAIEKKSNKLFANYQLFMDIFNLAVLAIALILAKFGMLAVGGIITIWQLNKNILQSVQTINSSYSDLYLNNEKAAEAKCFLEEFTDGYNQNIEDNKKMKENVCSALEIKEALKECEIAYEVKNAAFSYIEGSRVLSGINLKIRRGETVAICGANGSGKSTLIKLLSGLYAPDEGEIRVYGKKTDELKTGIFGAAFQDFVSYPFSFRENVGFGCLDEMDKDEAVRLASEQGQALEILEKYGMDKLLTKSMDDRGAELSGGEWQRIALSRANMGQKALLIFDEPTAKLDPLAELKMYSRIREMMRGRTVLLVSHRIGFARLAERILVMKDGKIVEDGSHESLIRRNGEYKKMLEEQAGWYDTTWEGLE